MWIVTPGPQNTTGLWLNLLESTAQQPRDHLCTTAWHRTGVSRGRRTRTTGIVVILPIVRGGNVVKHLLRNAAVRVMFSPCQLIWADFHLNYTWHWEYVPVLHTLNSLPHPYQRSLERVRVLEWMKQHIYVLHDSNRDGLRRAVGWTKHGTSHPYSCLLWPGYSNRSTLVKISRLWVILSKVKTMFPLTLTSCCQCMPHSVHKIWADIVF